MKEELELLKEQYNKFRTDNTSIFDIDAFFFKQISLLEDRISNEIELNKPPFPFPDLDPDSLEQLSYDFIVDAIIITEDLIDGLDNDYYNEQLMQLIGWKVSFEDESFGAVNDGDYYHVSIELTDPDGNVYSVSDETCMAVGYNFGDKRFS